MLRSPRLRSALVAAMLVGAMTAVCMGAAQNATPEPGYIEVHAPGLDGAVVFLGGKKLGSIKNGRLLAPNVYPGKYQLRIELDPYYPTQVPITVTSGHGVAVTLDAGSLSVQDQIQQSATDTATLRLTNAGVRLTCFPMACTLKITAAAGVKAPPGFTPQTFSKRFGDDSLLVTGLPQGKYTLTVTSALFEKKMLTTDIGLCDGARVKVVANFKAALGGLTTGLTDYPNCRPLKVQTTSP